jgi:hypothetical protein
MKTMSWSRYHCLSWSFVRIRTGLRRGGLTRTRHRAPTAAISAAAAKAGRRRHYPPTADTAGKGHPARRSDS